MKTRIEKRPISILDLMLAMIALLITVYLLEPTGLYYFGWRLEAIHAFFGLIVFPLLILILLTIKNKLISRVLLMFTLLSKKVRASAE